MTFREKLLAVSLAISLFLGIGLSAGQQFFSLDLGRSEVVGVYSSIPDLLFNPAFFDIGTIFESTSKNYTLTVTNTHPSAINISWTHTTNSSVSGTGFRAPVALELYFKPGESPFQCAEIFQARGCKWIGGVNNYTRIEPGQTFNLTARIWAGVCSASCPPQIPFQDFYKFFGTQGDVELPGIDWPIVISNVSVLSTNFTITYNATYTNMDNITRDIDTIRRLEFGGIAIEQDASRHILAPNQSQTVSGLFNRTGLNVEGNVFFLQFEALTPPPGSQLAQRVRRQITLQGSGSAAEGILAEAPFAPVREPAGEPEAIAPEGELAEPLPLPGAELRTIGGIIPEPLLPPIIIMGAIGVAITALALVSRRSKAKARTKVHHA